jgi:hypothetical protein
MLVFVETLRPQNNVTTFMELLFLKFIFAQLFRNLVPFPELKMCYPVNTVHPSTVL